MVRFIWRKPKNCSWICHSMGVYTPRPSIFRHNFSYQCSKCPFKLRFLIHCLLIKIYSSVLNTLPCYDIYSLWKFILISKFFYSFGSMKTFLRISGLEKHDLREIALIMCGFRGNHRNRNNFTKWRYVEERYKMRNYTTLH